MPGIYDQLLESVVHELESLKARGVQYVSVSPGTLEALGAGARPTGTAKDRRATAPTTTAPKTAEVPSRVQTVKSPPSISKPAEAKNAPQKQAGFLGIAGDSSAETRTGVSLSPEARTAAFADLRQRAMACVKCPHLASSRKTVVFGVGSINADLMFVGEAPGADEDEQGEPFVGRAGQLLTKIIETMGLSRDTVYIGNILKCRPDTPGQTAGNRKPTTAEMQTCIPYLHEQIDLIKPKVLVALGGTAVEGLLGKTAGIMRLRGNWQTYRGTPLMPTFHPAYLLRNQGLPEKRKVWEDMLQVMEKLEMSISEKQKRFFLKA